MSQVAVAKALSSEISWKILDLLMARELGEQEISNSLHIRIQVVKSHLNKLVQAGIVTAHEKTLRSGKVSRDFRLTGVGRSVGFPPRDYLLLSEALINSLRTSLGEDGARKLLGDMGNHIGENFAEMLIVRTKLAKWDPTTYAEIYVKGSLAEMGFYPKLVEAGRNHVVYEESNCLFQDLAVKYPGLVCDVLDEAVHEGIDRKLGASKTTRLKCRGHGDPVCRYRTDFRAQ